MEQIPGPQPFSQMYGLPGEDLDTVIERYRSASKTDPFATWILVPTRRLAGCIADELALRAIPFIPSRICTIDGFCHTLFEENRTTERFLHKTGARMLLAQILEEKKDEVPFFITRDRPAPGTIDDLMTFMNVTLNRKVPFPECLLELQGEKIRQLDTIITAYRDALNKRDLFDDDTILEWTIDSLNRTKSSPLGTVFVYGFYEPLPLEEDLFGALRERSLNAHFFTPTGLDRNIFRNGPVPDSPAVLPSGEPAQRTLQLTGLFSETGSLGTPGFFRVQTFPTRYAEVYAVAAEIARLNREGMPLSDIAVVFPDLREDLALVNEVFAEAGIPWNAAVSSLMAKAPVVRFLTGIIRVAESGYAREDVVRMIQSPYFRKKSVPGGSVRLDASEVDLVSRYARIDGPRPDWERELGRLREQVADPERAKNYPGISLPAVERVQGGIRILTAGLDTLAGKKRLRDHIDAFEEFLTTWEIPFLSGAPDEETGEEEAKVCAAFLSRVRSLATAAWIDTEIPVPPDEFFRLVRAIAEEPDESSLPDKPGVTLLGPRECPHMKFPVVFVCGLTEGTFPRLTTRLPFTNTLENKRMGTRTLSEVLREEQYYFIAALLLAKEKLYLSAPLADGEKPLLTSAFFERVRMRTGECPWPDPSGIPASRRTAAVRAGREIRAGRAHAACSLIPAPLVMGDLVERVNMEGYDRQGGCDTQYDGILSGYEPILAILAGRYGTDHVWSPTNLELYASCPFAYFSRRVLGLEPLPDVELDLSAADRGSAIHDVLSTFYRQWLGLGQTRVTPATLADATELILHIAQESLDRYSFQSPLWDATRILMLGDKVNGPGYFERFLSCETEEADSPLVPSRFEYSFGMGSDGEDAPGAGAPAPVELSSPEGTHRMLVRGRIDRIDQAPDGSFLIYDYKSGVQHPKTKDIEEGTALQLPLYLLAYEKISGGHGIAGGYYTIRREINRSIVLADAIAKDLMISWPRVSADFPGLLHHSLDCSFAYIDRIRGGRFPLPDREECPNAYCEFRRICRFDPYRVLSCREES